MTYKTELTKELQALFGKSHDLRGEVEKQDCIITMLGESESLSQGRQGTVEAFVIPDTPGYKGADGITAVTPEQQAIFESLEWVVKNG